jgi:hypothetical protein
LVEPALFFAGLFNFTEGKKLLNLLCLEEVKREWKEDTARP